MPYNEKKIKRMKKGIDPSPIRKMVRKSGGDAEVKARRKDPQSVHKVRSSLDGIINKAQGFLKKQQEKSRTKKGLKKYIGRLKKK